MSTNDGNVVAAVAEIGSECYRECDELRREVERLRAALASAQPSAGGGTVLLWGDGLSVRGDPESIQAVHLALKWAEDTRDRATPSEPAPAAAGSAEAVARTTERHIALREAHCIKAVDDYFAPRPVEDGAMSRRAFEQGFARGFDASERISTPPLQSRRRRCV